MSGWTPGPGWLFCPADRPDRYVKALARADVVVVDLEDAVAASAKAEARDALRQLAAEGDLVLERTVLRVNGAGTDDHDEDVRLASEVGLGRVMLAKAESPATVAAIPAEVVALVETPLGVVRADELAAVDNVVALMWGADDLVAGLGGTASHRADGSYRDVAVYARSRSLVAAKARGRLALDAVHMDIADLDGLRAACEDAAAVGFDATVAIHPSQVPVIRAAYRPSPDQVAWARALLQAHGEDGGVGTFEGRMVDGPVFRQAVRVLTLEQAAGGGTTPAAVAR
ncbi:MAG: HpcH/HpaI aldolase/citrate lyase family protein [Janthinobacterium lividum]